MARVKCPICGSRNTAEILYGMPAMNSELEAKINSGEIFIGGCDVPINGPLRHCYDCGEDFGGAGFYPTRSEDRPGLIPCYISCIEFSVGGYFDGYDTVVFKATEDGADVTVSHEPPVDDKNIDKELHITQRRWQNLIDKLVDQLYVNEWEEKYVNPHIVDGTQWGLTIKEGDVPIIKSYGSNDYPPYWEEMLQTISYYSETHLS